MTHHTIQCTYDKRYVIYTFFEPLRKRHQHATKDTALFISVLCARALSSCMYISMCVCVYIYIHICIVCVHVCACACMCVCVGVNTFISVLCIRAHTYML